MVRQMFTPIWAANWMILAQSDRFQDLGGRFRQGGSDISIVQIVAVALAVVLLSFGLWCIARWYAVRDRRGYRSVRKLFVQLCRLHEIDWPSRRLLCQLARAQGVSQPAELFLMPERFDVESLSPEMQSHSLQIQELKQRIFGKQVGALPASAGD